MLAVSYHSEVCVGMDESPGLAGPHSACILPSREGNREGERLLRAVFLYRYYHYAVAHSVCWLFPRSSTTMLLASVHSSVLCPGCHLGQQPLWQYISHQDQCHAITVLSHLPVLLHLPLLSFHLFLRSLPLFAHVPPSLCVACLPSTVTAYG